MAAVRLARRLGGRATIQVNLAVAAAGLASVASPAGSWTDGFALAGPILALGFGLGGIIASLFSTIPADITPAEGGSVSGSPRRPPAIRRINRNLPIATLYTAAGYPRRLPTWCEVPLKAAPEETV